MVRPAWRHRSKPFWFGEFLVFPAAPHIKHKCLRLRYLAFGALFIVLCILHSTLAEVYVVIHYQIAALVSDLEKGKEIHFFAS